MYHHNLVICVSSKMNKYNATPQAHKGIIRNILCGDRVIIHHANVALHVSLCLRNMLASYATLVITS